MTNDPESSAACPRCGRHEPHSHPELWGKEKLPTVEQEQDRFDDRD